MDLSLRNSRYIGDKEFYKKACRITIPMMIQTGLYSLVNLLDNIMLGHLDETVISGVAIASQLFFVFAMGLMGILSGASIFAVQSFGKGDYKGFGTIFRIKLIITFVYSALALVIFAFFADDMIRLFLHTSDRFSADDVGEVLDNALVYMKVMLYALPFFTLSFVYSSILRECNETKVPMYASFASVICDLVFNYIFIFGRFGVPAMGIAGAAWATFIARCVECAINVIWTHRHGEQLKFVKYVYNELKVPLGMLKSIVIKSIPLFINEFLWSMSLTTVMKIYSDRGTDIVVSLGICSVLSALFSMFYLSLGTAAGIIVGQRLGADELKEAKDTARKLLVFALGVGLIEGLLMMGISGVFPKFYEISHSIRVLTTKFIIIYALAMPFLSYTHSAYYVLRSGGKVFIIFLFDCVFSWAIYVPLAFVLVHFTNLSIIVIYLIVNLSEIIKCSIATVFLKKFKWAINIVGK